MVFSELHGQSGVKPLDKKLQATPQSRVFVLPMGIREGDRWGSNPRPSEPQVGGRNLWGGRSGALAGQRMPCRGRIAVGLQCGSRMAREPVHRRPRLPGDRPEQEGHADPGVVADGVPEDPDQYGERHHVPHGERVGAQRLPDTTSPLLDDQPVSS